MPFQSNLAALSERELADYGFARARDIAFDAVQVLWRRRQAEGMKQKEVAQTIGRDPGWVSKNLRGPGNWTLRTIGELVEALDGEIEISVHAQEDAIAPRANFDAYLGYSDPTKPRGKTDSTGTVMVLKERGNEQFKLTVK